VAQRTDRMIDQNTSVHDLQRLLTNRRRSAHHYNTAIMRANKPH